MDLTGIMDLSTVKEKPLCKAPGAGAEVILNALTTTNDHASAFWPRIPLSDLAPDSIL